MEGLRSGAGGSMAPTKIRVSASARQCPRRRDGVRPFGTSGAAPRSGIMGRMKGALAVDEPQGERWGLALDLLSQGPELVALGSGLLLNRDTSGPAADGHIHIGVVANGPKEQAQSEVDAARQLVSSLANEDERFGTLLRSSA